MWSGVCVAVIIISMMLYFIKLNMSNTKRLKKIPGPKGIFIFGNAFDFFQSSGMYLPIFQC